MVGKENEPHKDCPKVRVQWQLFDLQGLLVVVRWANHPSLLVLTFLIPLMRR